MKHVRMVIALPFFLLGLGLQMLSIYIGGEPFAAIYLESLKKNLAKLG